MSIKQSQILIHIHQFATFNSLRPSVNYVIGSSDGLIPVEQQVITGTNADLMSTALRKNFSKIWIKIIIGSLEENAFESVVPKMTTILSRPQYDKNAVAITGTLWYLLDNKMHCC